MWFAVVDVAVLAVAVAGVATSPVGRGGLLGRLDREPRTQSLELRGRRVFSRGEIDRSWEWWWWWWW